MKTKSIYWKLSLIINNILLITHALQFVRSDFYWKPLVYIGICILFDIAIVVSDGKYLSEFFLVAGLGFIACNRFDDPSPFMIIAIGIYLKPTRKTIYTLIYVAAWLIMMAIYHDTFTHAIIHACICCLVLIGEIQLEHAKAEAPKEEPLVLTPSEEDILRQIADGAEIKAISGYSENTAYKKLREARIRNNVRTNWELVSKFTKQ